ncbi:MAG TPA: hypothetical protein HA355_03340 [Methanosphaera sp.]|nr:hypothetical protein [Methanosphaera sp.]
MEKKQVKIRIDLIGTAPMDNSSINLDNTTIDKIQTVRIYDKNKSKKILALKETDIRQYLKLSKRRKKNDK